MVKKSCFPIIISSPSGGGKSTICEEIIKSRKDIKYSISYTTRPPRSNEVNGVDYYFISEEKFKSLKEEGVFLEWAKVHGYYYATSREFIERELDNGFFIILDIDTEGTKQFIKRIPETLSFFLFPPSFKVLEKRLRKRATDSEDIIKLRLENAKKEFAQAWIYDILLINDEVQKVVKKILKIIDNKIRMNTRYTM